jgi:hypothetical protein
MKLHPPVRTLATAALLALGILSGPAGLALATSNDAERSCNARGYHYDTQRQECWDKKCTWDGRTYEPGADRTIRSPGGGVWTLICNGGTGHWVTLGPTQTPETHPLVPETGTARPGVSSPTTDTTPLAPVAPRPSRNSR